MMCRRNTQVYMTICAQRLRNTSGYNFTQRLSNISGYNFTQHLRNTSGYHFIQSLRNISRYNFCTAPTQLFLVQFSHNAYGTLLGTISRNRNAKLWVQFEKALSTFYNSLWQPLGRFFWVQYLAAFDYLSLICNTFWCTFIILVLLSQHFLSHTILQHFLVVSKTF